MTFQKGYIPYNKGAIGICKIDNCDKKVHGNKYCGMHYMRIHRNGDPLKTQRAPFGSGWVRKDGYRMFQIEGKDILEHRLVMEEKLGRPLTDREVVHHINGNRLDNRIENLMLFSTNSEHIRKYKTPCLKCDKLARSLNLCRKHYLQQYYQNKRSKLR